MPTDVVECVVAAAQLRIRRAPLYLARRPLADGLSTTYQALGRGDGMSLSPDEESPPASAGRSRAAAATDLLSAKGSEFGNRYTRATSGFGARVGEGRPSGFEPGELFRSRFGLEMVREELVDLGDRGADGLRPGRRRSTSGL